MTLNDYIIDADSKLSVILGGSTALVDPNTHLPDPLEQILLIALAGQVSVEKAIVDKFGSFDIRVVDCECLDIVAARTGDFRRTNKQTKVGIVITGSNGTVLPANSGFNDSYGNSWYLESKITIVEGIGFGTALSSLAGEYSVAPNDLYLTTSVDGVTKATNSNIIELGYTTESCEQFRSRLINKKPCALETEATVINELLKEADFAKFISDYPDCDSNCLTSGFVVRGGDNNTIASIIRQYAPLNYMRLAGNVEINFPFCETVKFIRPCGVGIQIEYKSDDIIDDSEFESIICQENGSLYAKMFNDLPIDAIRFRTVRATPASLACDDITEVSSCGETVSLISEDCPCSQDSCNDTAYKGCAELESWEYPLFISAVKVDDC